MKESQFDRLRFKLLDELSRAHYRFVSQHGFKYSSIYRILLRVIGRKYLREALKLPPILIPEYQTGETAVHILTKDSEVKFAIWALYSLMIQLPKRIPVFLYGDGSLEKKHIDQVNSVLPGVRVVSRDEALKQASKDVPWAKNLLRLASNNGIALKLLNPWIFQTSGKRILMDSDVLVLKSPKEVLDWLANKKEDAALTCRWNRELHVRRQEPIKAKKEGEVSEGTVGFNSGFGCHPESLMNINYANELLGTEKFKKMMQSWLVEQEVYRHLSAKHGFSFFPPSYAIGLPPKEGDNAVVRHYVGTIRALFISNGLRRLRKQLLQAS